MLDLELKKKIINESNIPGKVEDIVLFDKNTKKYAVITSRVALFVVRLVSYKEEQEKIKITSVRRFPDNNPLNGYSNLEKAKSRANTIESLVKELPSENMCGTVSREDSVENILIIGRTGSGKSALGNLLLNKEGDLDKGGEFKKFFEENEYSVSEMQEIKSKEVEIEGIKFCIIDTIGFNCDRITNEEIIVSKIFEVCRKIKDGLSQILFVVSGRFSPSEIEVYNVIRKRIFGKDIAKYTTIIRTNFPDFDDENKYKEEEEIRRVEKKNSRNKMVEEAEDSLSSLVEAVIEVRETILLIGKTGGGKSTLANVLVGTNDFAESAGSVSKTKQLKERTFTEGEIKYRVIDTVGIGDTGMSLDRILRKLALMGYSVKDGLHQILGEEERYEKECEKDKKKISENNQVFGELIRACRGMIYVDNDSEEKRKKSREILLEYFNSHKHELYIPKNLVELSKKISEDEKKKREIKKERMFGKLKNKLINNEITEKMVRHIEKLDEDLEKEVAKTPDNKSYEHIKHIKKKCLDLFEKEKSRKIEELVYVNNIEDKKRGEKISDDLRIGIEVILEIIKVNEGVKSCRQSAVVGFGKKVDAERLEEIFSLQEELVKIQDEIDEEVLEDTCQKFEKKYLKKVTGNELDNETLKNLRRELKQLIIMKKATNFLKDKKTFLEKRQENIKGLENCYNELNNFVNREYAERTVRIKLMNDMTDALNCDKVNPIKMFMVLATTQNEYKKINLSEEISSKFNNCLKDDKNNISLFKKSYEFLKNNVYDVCKNEELETGFKIIEILKLEDKTEEGSVKAFKPFNARYETICEIVND
ncbi:1444_t:CDS:2 [Paraglomus occultum]|uniref:1444_t:CDS:1 n=1 Tax=Paraglomus occultum TaxID=144539 RepID=A0A9N8VPK4_9GLOM|nr:1444_t:CDS:2 [Paraglomus occultum]